MTIKSDVVRQPDSTYPIIINPYRIYVSRAGDIEVSESGFTIKNVCDTDIGVTVVGAPPGYFQIDIPETIASGEKAECLLSVNPEFLGDNSFEKSITLELNDASKTRFTIPVVRRLIGQKSGAPSTKGAAPQGGKTGTSKKLGGK